MSQDNNQLAVKPRSEFGKNASRRARREGLVPAIIYLKGRENQAVYLDAGEWESVARHNHHVVYLADGAKTQAALVREVQFNHMKNHCVHVDFQAVDAGETVHSTVSLHAFGDCIGVTRGGVLDQLMHELPIEGKPADLVDSLNVDVTDLGIGDSLLAGDIKAPAGLKVLAGADEVVFHVLRPTLETESAAGGELTEPEAIKEKKKEE